jgi:hypothetical protein
MTKERPKHLGILLSLSMVANQVLSVFNYHCVVQIVSENGTVLDKKLKGIRSKAFLKRIEGK